MKKVKVKQGAIVALNYIGHGEYYLTIQLDEVIRVGKYQNQNMISTVKIHYMSDMFFLLKDITKAESVEDMINKYITVALDESNRIQGFDVPTSSFTIYMQVLPAYLEKKSKKLITNGMYFSSNVPAKVRQHEQHQQELFNNQQQGY